MTGVHILPQLVLKIPSGVLLTNSYDCVRYLPWYLKSTISLSASCPQVNEYLEKGGLSVQLGSVNSTNLVEYEWIKQLKRRLTGKLKHQGEQRDSVHEPVLSQNSISLLNI